MTSLLPVILGDTISHSLTLFVVSPGRRGRNAAHFLECDEMQPLFHHRRARARIQEKGDVLVKAPPVPFHGSPPSLNEPRFQLAKHPSARRPLSVTIDPTPDPRQLTGRTLFFSTNSPSCMLVTITVPLSKYG